VNPLQETGMEITRTVEIAYPVDSVWRALCDINLVADCLPGASIVGDLGEDRYKGRFQVKVGPLAAAFDGEVAIERRPETLSATVSGKGADSKSSSRASGALTYRLENAGAAATRISIESEINLAGALAQFGKAAVIQEIANRITSQFVKNLEVRLAASEPVDTAEPAAAPVDAPTTTPPPAAQPLDAGGLMWSILRDRIVAWFRRLFGLRH
jgi:carbon monoxide dehydrogenase subunit G